MLIHIYLDRLLPLPPFLSQDAPADAAGVADGFRLTGHFLATHIAGPVNKPLPEARERFVRTVVKAIDRTT
ncbi:MAG: hypothetical protein AAGF49_05615 [Pseudomonadota bacterium]